MITAWILLAALAGSPGVSAPRGALEATIRGTRQPLEVELLVREPSDEWKEVGHQSLPAGVRRVRFDGLASGVYQLRVGGPQKTERFAMKVGVGNDDLRRVTVNIKPFELRGRITHGGTALGAGALFLRHPELRWEAGVEVAADGTFRVPLWQRGDYRYTLRAPALPTTFSDAVTLDGDSPILFDLDIPDGRIAGVVRDAKSGAPIAGVTVALQSNVADTEQHVRLTTNDAGRFDFLGIKYGRHTVRVASALYLEPAPVEFELDANHRLRELDLPLDPGRTVPIVVIDPENDPVGKAHVFSVARSKLCARGMTDEDGRVSIAVPEHEAATLFVVPAEGAFGVLRVGRELEKGRLRVYLPRASSSLSIRALTTDGNPMPPISLLMRYNGALVPPEVAEELAATQGMHLATSAESEALLRNIPGGSYEFWPYRTPEEVEAIVASSDGFAAPIQVNVRTGENRIAVKFAAKR